MVNIFGSPGFLSPPMRNSLDPRRAIKYRHLASGVVPQGVAAGIDPSFVFQEADEPTGSPDLRLLAAIMQGNGVKR